MMVFTAAEFSLYLSIVVVICILGLAWWSWTQFQDINIRLKNIDKLLLSRLDAVQHREEPNFNQLAAQLSSLGVLPIPVPSDESDDEDEKAQPATTVVIESSIADQVINALETNMAEGDKSTDENVTVGENVVNDLPAADEIVTDSLDSFFPTTLTEIDTTPKVDENTSLKELRSLAEKKGIKGAARMKKPELLSLLT